MMEMQDYVAMRELEQNHGSCWAKSAPIWVIAVVVVIGYFVYSYNKSCNEKVAFATGLANLDGRINCIAPQVATLNNQMYGAAQAFAGLTVGVNDIKQVYGEQIGQLNNTVFYNPANNGWFGTACVTQRNGCGCGCPSRVFAQTSTYAQTGTPQVTVTESCANDRC